MKGIKLFLSLSLILFAGTGCQKKAVTMSVERPAPRRPAPAAPSGDRPVFVTESPVYVMDLPAAPVETVPEPEAAVEMPSVRPEPLSVHFSDKETGHVRITYDDPFGGASELTIDLEALRPFFCYPCPGNKISDYGMRGRAMHAGIDIKALPNDTVRAALDGVVRMSKLYSNYGNIVVIRHCGGLETAYAHNSKNLVRPNDAVRAGDPIALAGRTGRATTEHVHFETRIQGEHFDPNLLLDAGNRTLRGGRLYLVRRNGRITASNSGYAPASAPVVPVSAPQRTASAAPLPELYSVRRGDTLYSISRRYGLPVDRLCTLNGISGESVLSIGQKLKLK